MINRILLTLSFICVFTSFSVPEVTNAQDVCRAIYCIDGQTGETLLACQDWVEEGTKCVSCTEFCNPIIVEG